jgi:hypothetical protein
MPDERLTHVEVMAGIVIEQIRCVGRHSMLLVLSQLVASHHTPSPQPGSRPIRAGPRAGSGGPSTTR